MFALLLVSYMKFLAFVLLHILGRFPTRENEYGGFVLEEIQWVYSTSKKYQSSVKKMV